jgi:dihydrolipoamide dehydrogenase
VIILKEYDIVAIGTGSAMNIVSGLLNNNPDLKVAVIDKDRPGGICLTKGCIPTKILLYPAEVINTIRRSGLFGIKSTIEDIDFSFVMERMREIINEDIENIHEGLSSSDDLDYYQEIAEFVKPSVLKVGNEKIKGKHILLCTGSKPTIPLIKGLTDIDYHTSDTILRLEKLPRSICIVGGGYIGAEYGHFFAAMGSKVTIVGRNSQFLPDEEPEIGFLAQRKLGEHMTIHTNHEVIEIQEVKSGNKKIIAKDKTTKEKLIITADEVLIATGRSSNSDILRPEKGGIETDEKGWIKVDKYLRTSQENVWAFGDATGEYLFKHVANYESEIVYYNAFGEQEIAVDYHAVPHAVFTEPEIAAVGMTEKEAIKEYGKDDIVIGFQRYEDTAKGIAMALKDFFVKIIMEQQSRTILGAHIIGPHASILIQELINLMYTKTRSIVPIYRGMHIHPALPEVVERAAGNLMPVDHYHHFLKHIGLENDDRITE